MPIATSFDSIQGRSRIAIAAASALPLVGYFLDPRLVARAAYSVFHQVAVHGGAAGREAVRLGWNVCHQLFVLLAASAKEVCTFSWAAWACARRRLPGWWQTTFVSATGRRHLTRFVSAARRRHLLRGKSYHPLAPFALGTKMANGRANFVLVLAAVPGEWDEY